MSVAIIIWLTNFYDFCKPDICSAKVDNPGLQIFIQVCTGHSLGGGTAAILSILLQEEYPDVTCYAFSPPGGLLR